jgi:hypothetical protein
MNNKKGTRAKRIAIVMLLLLSAILFSCYGTHTLIRQNNPIVRVAQEDEGDSRFISTYNKIKNTVTLQKYSISTGSW